MYIFFKVIKRYKKVLKGSDSSHVSNARRREPFRSEVEGYHVSHHALLKLAKVEIAYSWISQTMHFKNKL